MKPGTLTDEQLRIAKIPLENSVFLEGAAGTGKTTCAILRMEKLLSTMSGNQILVLVPQRSLGSPYFDLLKTLTKYEGGLPSILSFGGLARRMVALFWPLIAVEAGFTHPAATPQFLSIETAQYCMSKAIKPLLDQGFFQSVVISRNRIYGQILDDLNKSAVVGFPISELPRHLKSTANPEAGLVIAYDQVLVCAEEFRKFCYQNSVLDYSLQIEVFTKFVWNRNLCRDYFYANYRAFIADNVEEDVPVAHDFIKEWLPNFESAFIICDTHGGYRSFLGADPVSAESIKPLCAVRELMVEKIIQNSALENFSTALGEAIDHSKNSLPKFSFSESVKINDFHFYPEMIAGVCDQIKAMIESEEINPGEIAIVSPFLSDALNFALSAGLSSAGVPHRSARPSQMYITDPGIRAFFTFAKTAHPQWLLPITPHEMRNALMVVLPGLDIVKADLIVSTLFSAKHRQEGLRSFDTLTNHSMQERISFKIGEKLERISNWIEAYKGFDPLPLDVFFCMLFGELLSQKGFSLFSEHDAAVKIFQMTQSIRDFRQFVTRFMNLDPITAGFEYLTSVEKGLLPASIFDYEDQPRDVLLIAPAHTYLMENRPVDYQFWLDIGSLGWWERLNQPLANPYLLKRGRDAEEIWTDAHEYAANQEGMARIVAGLINRCRKMVFVNTVRINEYGSEQRGPLLKAFHTLQKRIFLMESGKKHV